MSVRSHARFTVIALALLAFGFAAQAEERNGLSVLVVKKTLDRADRSASYAYDRIDRTQGLRVTIKNATFKPMADGEIDWTILVRQYSSTSIEKYTGKEKLKALKPAETAELVIGAAQITGWRDWGNQWKDKVEFQVIITQDGKETFRTASTNSFDILAKRAVKAAK
jgi:hypothetical protein